MHMTGGETFTLAQEVAIYFASVGTKRVSTAFIDDSPTLPCCVQHSRAIKSPKALKFRMATYTRNSLDANLLCDTKLWCEDFNIQ